METEDQLAFIKGMFSIVNFCAALDNKSWELLTPTGALLMAMNEGLKKEGIIKDVQ